MSKTKSRTAVQFKATRRTLLDALQKLLVVQAPKYGQLPVDHFHVDVRKTGITLTRTNIDLQLSCKVQARGLATGKMLLPPQVIPFLKASTARDVTLSLADHPQKYEDKAVDKNLFVVDAGPYSYSTTMFYKVYKSVTKTRHTYEVTVAAGATTSTLESRDTEDFPPVTEVTGKTVKVAGLAKAFDEVSYAVAREDSRPVLAGINLTLGKGSMELAAADGFRLAVTRTQARGKADSVIVPMPAAKIFQKHIKGTVVMKVGPPTKEGQARLIAFEGDGYTLVSRAILGTFPSYHQLIPTRGKHLKVSTRPLAEAVKMALTAGGVVALESTSKGLKVSGKGGMTGSNRVETLIKAAGKAQIAFNAHYLMDLLGRVGDRIDMLTTDAKSPAVVKHNSTTHVLMPMHFEWEKKPKVFNGVSEVKV